MPIGFSAEKLILRKGIIDMTNASKEPSTLKRSMWFVGIWCAGVAVLAVVAYAIKWAIM
jgi:hypothetical protein